MLTRDDKHLDKVICNAVAKRNAVDSAKHKPSGKLSASRLNDPVQWQILHTLATDQDEIDDYTLRKFLRGKQVEDWYVSEIHPIETQKFVEYRNCVGYIDAIVDTKDWDFPSGVIPLEIKSTSNAKFKRIVKQGADKGHILQAGFYAICLKSDRFAVSYVATDDYRIKTFLFETKDVRDEIDQIITTFNDAKKVGTIPVFVAREKWQSNPDYNRYFNFIELDEKQLAIEYKLITQ
jgi:hypothetical protein